MIAAFLRAHLAAFHEAVKSGEGGVGKGVCAKLTDCRHTTLMSWESMALSRDGCEEEVPDRCLGSDFLVAGIQGALAPQKTPTVSSGACG